jgi:hypothetical protein
MNAVRDRAWWVLAAFGVLLVVFGVTDMAAGADADPGIALGLTGLSPAELRGEHAAAYRMFDFTVRTQAILLIVVGVLFMAILLGPYRTRQAWAWRLMWLLPAWSFSVPALYLAFGLSPDQAPPPPLVSGPVLGVVAALALLLDRTQFAGSEVSRPASVPAAAQ